MYIARSRDGTQIACRDAGQGSPVLLVHGTAADSLCWDPIVAMLSQRFKVYLVDRRGRGNSGDTPPYDLQREYEDIAAIIESIGQPVAVVGRSFGGLCALEACLLTSNVRKLALHEPATRPADLPAHYSEELIEEIERLLADGQDEAAVALFLIEALRSTPEQIALLKTQALWKRRLATAHTIPRELRARRDYTLDPARFADFNTPTLLLLGSESPEAPRRQTEAAAAALPVSHVVELSGQGAMALDVSPGLFVRELVEFLRDTF
jgi:pimeloyl-ACP methyl ester carboxylesterase